MEIQTITLEHGHSVRGYFHAAEDCFLPESCTIHVHSDHRLRHWPQYWRADRVMMERTCPHGIGHPDPDQVLFWRAVYPDTAWTDEVHGCDGCCK